MIAGSRELFPLYPWYQGRSEGESWGARDPPWWNFLFSKWTTDDIEEVKRRESEEFSILWPQKPRLKSSLCWNLFRIRVFSAWQCGEYPGVVHCDPSFEKSWLRPCLILPSVGIASWLLCVRCPLWLPFCSSVHGSDKSMISWVLKKVKYASLEEVWRKSNLETRVCTNSESSLTWKISYWTSDV